MKVAHLIVLMANTAAPSPAPDFPVSDTFSRPDSATSLGITDSGATWIPGRGTWGISGNYPYVAVLDPSPDDINIAVVETETSDVAITVTVDSFPGLAPDVGIALRYVDAGNWLSVLVSPASGSIAFETFTGGTFSASEVVTGLVMTPPLTLRVDCVGAAIRVRINDGVTADLRRTITDHQTATKHGLIDYTDDTTDVSLRVLRSNFSIATPDAVPLELISDTFNRMDDSSALGLTDTGQVWTNGRGTWGIANNQAYLAVHDGGSRNVAVVETGMADGVVEATLTASEGYHEGVTFRYVDPNNWLAITVSPGSDQMRLYRRVAGVGGVTPLVDIFPLTFSLPLTLRVEFVGTNVVVKVNGVLQVTATVTELTTATMHGLFTSAAGSPTSTRWDNFKVFGP